MSSDNFQMVLVNSVPVLKKIFRISIVQIFLKLIIMKNLLHFDSDQNSVLLDKRSTKATSRYQVFIFLSLSNPNEIHKQWKQQPGILHFTYLSAMAKTGICFAVG